MAHVAEAVGDGGRVEARIRFWASDGRHSAAVEGRKWPLEGGGDGVLFQLDTAPRRRAAQAPLPSEAPDEIDALLGPFPLPIALFSPRGPCVYANAAFEDCLGAARGPSLTELAGSARGAARLIRAVLNGRTLRISPTLRWKGKEMSFVMDAARVTDPRTEREAVLVQLANVDARRAQERRLQDGLRTARTLLESVIEGWISLDGQRRMTAFGGRGLTPFRARLDLSLGRPWRDVQQVLGLRKDAAAQEAAERALQPGTDRFVRLSGETDARLLRTRVRRRRSADGRTDGYHILFQSAEDLLPMLAAASLREAPAAPESPAPIAAPLAAQAPPPPSAQPTDQRALWTLSPIPLIAHDNFEIVFVNDAAVNLFGRLNANSLLATPFLDLFPEDEGRASRHYDMLGELNREATEHRLRARGPGGNTLWLDAAFQQAKLGERDVVLVALADISRLVAAEADAKRQETRSERWFEDAPVPLLALDDAGHIERCNRSALDYFDLPTDQFIGEAFDGFLLPSDRTAFGIRRTATERAGEDRGPVSLEATVAVRAGEPRAVTIALQPSRVGPGTSILLALLDRNSQIERESTLAERVNEAEDASRKKTSFLASVSHEMRTPLNAIIGFSEFMKEGRLGPIRNERYAEYIDDIHMSGQHLLSLVNDLLDMSKIEAGEYRVDMSEIDPGDAIAETLRILHPLADKREVTLIDDSQAPGARILADPRSLRQIILNLVSNAVKFTPAGGTVTVSSARDSVGSFKITVEDTGIGMSQADLEAALRPFQQIKSPGSDEFGTGLGLPLAKALSEANRALFEIESTPGQGTRVVITFPAGQVLASPGEPL